MILDKTQFADSVKKLVGDRTDDEALEIVQNITETIDDMETKASASINHEKELKELDETWRKKYRDTFFGETKIDKSGDSDFEDDEKPKKYTYENLFKESEV